MRKIWILLLLIVLLSGCAKEAHETTGAQTVPETTEPVALYIPDSDAEKASGGSVLAYGLPEPYDALYTMGSRILLVAADGRLAVVHGKEGVLTASMHIDGEWSCLNAGETGVGYYLPESRETVLLNTQLLEKQRFTLPDEMVGQPVISLQNNEVYYCTRDTVRARNVETGIARLLREHSYRDQHLTGSCFDGKILICHASGTSGEVTQFLSVSDGEQLYSADSVELLDTGGRYFYACYTEGITCRQVLGAVDSGVQKYLPATGKTAGVWAQNGILQFGQGEDGLFLDLYEPENGFLRASLQLPCVDTAYAACADAEAIWLLATDLDGKDLLLRWDPSCNPATEDDRCCVAPLDSAEAPDEKALKLCTDRAASFEKQYGVRVALYRDALRLAGEYPMVAEYLPDSYDILLDQLEAVLKTLPDGFVKRVADIRIGIVRSVSGKQEPVHIRSNGVHILLLPVCCELEQTFLMTLGEAMDAGLADRLDWDSLNPGGFQYGQTGDKYVKGFLDTESMESGKTERIRLFAAAMTAGRGADLASTSMQKKLGALCQAIRDAFQLTDETLPWEQYLKTK